MRTVFHTSLPAQYTVVDAKVRNLLADDAVEMDAVAVLVDRPNTIDAAASDMAGVTEAVVGAGGTVKLCANALGGADVDADDFGGGVEVVSSGVGELTRLQRDGWAYVRP